MAWLANWDKRIKVTADKDVVDSDLSHFPLTIRLGTAVGIGDVDTSCVFDELTSDANRLKIAVTKSDGTTQLKVEIEQWVDASEVAVLHCGITGDTLSSSADTDYYLYYDSSHAANTSYVGDTNSEIAEGVWDSNFKMVQHLADGANTSGTYDSTSNDNDGTKKGAAEPAVSTSGEMGNAQDFDGNDDYINTPWYVTANGTISVWVKTTTEGLMELWGNESSGAYHRANLNNGVITFLMYDGAWGIIDGNDDINDGNWHYVTCVWGSSGQKLYIDAVDDGTDAFTGYGNGAIGLQLGRNYNNGSPTWFLDGMLDELRASDSQRTLAWIKADYNSGNDSLLTYGSEEEEPAEDYTMTVTVGAFTLTGIANILTKALNMACVVGEFILTGIDAGIGRVYKIVAGVGSFILTGINILIGGRGDWKWSNQTKNTSAWSEQSKNTSDWSNQSKNTSTFSNQTKNTSDWTKQTKNDSTWSNQDKN